MIQEIIDSFVVSVNGYFLLSVCVPFTDLDDPVVTVHQSIGEAKEQFYYERTVFLRCVANSNPPVRYSWHRGREVLTQGSDKGVEIYEPFFTQVKGNVDSNMKQNSRYKDIFYGVGHAKVLSCYQ